MAYVKRSWVYADKLSPKLSNSKTNICFWSSYAKIAMYLFSQFNKIHCVIYVGEQINFSHIICIGLGISFKTLPLRSFKSIKHQQIYQISPQQPATLNMLLTFSLQNNLECKAWHLLHLNDCQLLHPVALLIISSFCND